MNLPNHENPPVTNDTKYDPERTSKIKRLKLALINQQDRKASKNSNVNKTYQNIQIKLEDWTNVKVENRNPGECSVYFKLRPG